MNTKLATTAAGVALLVVLVLVAIHRSHHIETTHPAAPRAGGSRPAATTPTGTPALASDAQRLLPFTLSQISQAATLAAAFTAAYASHRYDETPSAYLTRLAPMMSPQLRPVIERAANDPATLIQRRRLQEITTAQAQAEAIRVLGPTSITFVITVTEHVATAHANRTDTGHYALTLTHAGSGDGWDGWRVYAIELASTGNTGEITATLEPAS
jgi:hypothetical protein